jgi:ribosomal-protein-alanine N-acetyltransferase
MDLALGVCRVRRWHLEDAAALREQINNPRVSINLRDRVPYPYTVDDANAFLRDSLDSDPTTNFAIEVEGRVAGGIGVILHADIYRYSAELGYWLGEEFWGRGIATTAVRGVSDAAFDGYGLHRLFALVFAWNAASMRVLEKAGFVREAVHRDAAYKDGRFVDEVQFARLRGGGEGRAGW